MAGALAVLLAVTALGIALVRRTPAAPPPAAVEAASPGAPPDISGLSPRQRFDRLYARVMQAAQTGDAQGAERFAPMALGAYAQLDTIDADARFHAALLQVHSGNTSAAAALADTILKQNPGHLFGYVIRGAVARFDKDDRALKQAQRDFLAHEAAELKANRPEYTEHRRSLDDFKKAATAVPPVQGTQ
jgi:hypothetical protein